MVSLLEVGWGSGTLVGQGGWAALVEKGCWAGLVVQGGFGMEWLSWIYLWVGPGLSGCISSSRLIKVD